MVTNNSNTHVRCTRLRYGDDYDNWYYKSHSNIIVTEGREGEEIRSYKTIDAIRRQHVESFVLFAHAKIARLVFFPHRYK